MLRYLLDTNIVIYVIKRRALEVLETFNRHAGQMAISAVRQHTGRAGENRATHWGQ